MALIKYGAIIAAGSGKIGGHYLSNSLGGATIVTNPKQKRNQVAASQTTGGSSPYNRAAISGALLFVVKSWKSLSALNKTAWQLAAPNFPTTNRLGVPVKPSGYHCYVHVNYGYYINNGTLLSSPPANTVGIAPYAFTIVTVSSTEVKINLGAGVPAGYMAYLKCTRSMSAGVKPSSTFFSIIDYIATGTAGNLTVTTQYYNKFGAPITGDFLWIELVLSNLSTGVKGQPYILGSVIS